MVFNTQYMIIFMLFYRFTVWSLPRDPSKPNRCIFLQEPLCVLGTLVLRWDNWSKTHQQVNFWMTSTKLRFCGNDQDILTPTWRAYSRWTTFKSLAAREIWLWKLAVQSQVTRLKRARALKRQLSLKYNNMKYTLFNQSSVLHLLIILEWSRWGQTTKLASDLAGGFSLRLLDYHKTKVGRYVTTAILNVWHDSHSSFLSIIRTFLLLYGLAWV